MHDASVPHLGFTDISCCAEGSERATAMCEVNVGSVSLPRIKQSVKINYGLCLLRAPSFGRHLCCSKKSMQIIKANLSSVRGPLQQVSCSPPHGTPSLSQPRKQPRTKGECDGGTRGRGPASGERGSLLFQRGHTRSCSCQNTSRDLRVSLLLGRVKFGGRNTSHKPCCLEFKLISFCCAAI